MFPILFKRGPNKESLPQPALYLVGDCHLEGKAIYCRRARPSSSKAVTAQGKELTETEHVPRSGPPTPHTRARRKPDGSPSPRCHMRQTRGCGCNAGRALPRTGREHSGPVAHSRAFRRQGGDEEIVPSPSGAQLPRPPPFSFSGIFRMPRRAAGWEERRGRGRGVAATRSAPAAPRGRRAAAALLTPPPDEGNQRGHGRWPVPAGPAHAPPLTSLQGPSPHLGGLPPQTPRWRGTCPPRWTPRESRWAARSCWCS